MNGCCWHKRGTVVALALYLDDCAFSHILRTLLTTVGHRVVVPVDAGLVGAADDRHFAFTTANNIILVTKNPSDFIALHEEYQANQQDHPGIFVIYGDNDLRRDMTAAEIVRAIANVEGTQAPIPNHVVVLNHYRW
jgi:hypothetical protein